MGNNFGCEKTESLGEDLNTLPKPGQFEFADNKTNVWNDDYVKLPFASLNTSHFTNRSLWETIIFSLNHLSNILERCSSGTIAQAISKAVLKYRSDYGCEQTQNFDNLIFLFDSYSQAGVADEELRHLLKKMIESALNLPKLISQPIPLLKRGICQSVSLNTEQCASLLANCFFCTFPNVHNKQHLSNPNFIRLFTNLENGRNECKIEKLKCILNYFRRVLILDHENSIKTFSRHQERTEIRSLLENSREPIRFPVLELHAHIEDCHHATQLDFANKHLGGGVLGNGCVQEEIRFAICPEMIVALLFAESLHDDEAFYFTGCERFSSYSGYAGSFKFTGDYKSNLKKDEYNRLDVQVSAIDALKYNNKMDQFSERCIDREILKCYAGFVNSKETIAVGNWGCGAFNGIIELKYLIQLIASSQANRTLIYSVLGSHETMKKLSKLNKILFAKRCTTVSQLYKMLIDACRAISDGHFPYMDLNNLDFDILFNKQS